MSRALASLITPKAAARAAQFYDEHPDAYAYGADYCERLATKRDDKEPQDVAAYAAAILPAFVREGREDDRKAIRHAARRAVQVAAGKVAGDQERDADGNAVLPYDIFTDESRTVLTTYAPDPAAAYAVRALDYIAAALLRLENETHRETMRLAAIGMRRGAEALTTAATPRGHREQITAAKRTLKALEPRILADPYEDGTGDRTRQAWPTPHAGKVAGEATNAKPHTLTGQPKTPKQERPAQIPEWTFTGGTARPLIGACVAARLMDTGTPGTEITRLTITSPDGEVWATTYTAEEWTADDTRRLSQALTQSASTEALTHVERMLSAPRYGAPKKPSPRARSRVGSTGPTVPAKGMTR